MRPKVLIVTGPTGGHFFPGLSLAEQIQRAKWNVLMLIPAREALIKWVEKKNVSFYTLPATYSSDRNLLVFWFHQVKIFLWSWRVLKTERPHLIVATGSYLCVPVVIAGWLFGCKILLHEQNVIAGKTTRVLSLLADRVAVTFPETKGLPLRRLVVSGFPLVSDFLVKRERSQVLSSLGLSPGKTTLLVVGGSQAARALNELLVVNAPLCLKEDLQCLHLAGSEAERVQEAYNQAGVPAIVFRFCYDMASVYSASDLAVARAGAGTLVELVSWRLPALLVPYPYAGGHQEKNAEWLFQKQACLIMKQSNQNQMNKEFPDMLKSLLAQREVIRSRLARIKLADTEGRLLQLAGRLLAARN
ncbi:MAG: UDP-N-acetylglucosamine--N-acetylmuramyl-(pentapeptide) pyrophosphoryl-undecaprenol N-acetylglucosamine transferase [Candidatus Omnitrophica bacterium]|nr:UDP-N-acetylglucosamine--N-acetylmuramyl-(pentapeptide) pyrophosphoryl-undecaprenol N-acetylglucosamine transferase [Candidatus Omnitrophota bacterium]